MMKKNLLLSLLVFSIFQFTFGQIGFNGKETGKAKKIKKEVLEKFKKSTTIFVLTEAFNKKSFTEILDTYWTVTPYKIVSYKDFNKYNYADGNYSFAVTQGYKTKMVRTDSNGITDSNAPGTTFIHAFLSIRMFDFAKIKKRVKPKHSEFYIDAIEKEYTQYIARIEFFPNSKFILETLSNPSEDVYELMMTESVFHNNTLGHFKNNIQKLNQVALKGDEAYWMFGDDYLPELKKLATTKLFVPEYAVLNYNPFVGKEEISEDTRIQDIFENYEFDYEIIDSSELDDKILANEDIYYLRYARANSSKFIHVVHAKTGEVVYRKFINGFLVYNLKNRHLKGVNSKIKKALKK